MLINDVWCQFIPVEDKNYMPKFEIFYYFPPLKEMIPINLSDILLIPYTYAKRCDSEQSYPYLRNAISYKA